MNKIHKLLSELEITAPTMLFIAKLKNEYLMPPFENEIANNMVKGWRNMQILDLGCGTCRRQEFWRFWGANFTGVEIHLNTINIARSRRHNVIASDIRTFLKSAKNRSYDIIWALDVIEHLPKKDALIVLNDMERVARRQIIIWIPLGDVPQDGSYDGNPYQRHKSTWDEKVFIKRNYKCKVYKNYHYDIRHLSKRLVKRKKPVAADALLVTKII